MSDDLSKLCDAVREGYLADDHDYDGEESFEVVLCVDVAIANRCHRSDRVVDTDEVLLVGLKAFESTGIDPGDGCWVRIRDKDGGEDPHACDDMHCQSRDESEKEESFRPDAQLQEG